MAEKNRDKPGNTPVEQQERDPKDTEDTRPTRHAISGPGAADFIAAPGGVDRPESGTKGTGQLRGDEGPLADRERLSPRQGPDVEAFPREREPDEERPGSQTGTVGGGGVDARNPSAARATGVDDESVERSDK